MQHLHTSRVYLYSIHRPVGRLNAVRPPDLITHRGSVSARWSFASSGRLQHSPDAPCFLSCPLLLSALPGDVVSRGVLHLRTCKDIIRRLEGVVEHLPRPWELLESWYQTLVYNSVRLDVWMCVKAHTKAAGEGARKAFHTHTSGWSQLQMRAPAMMAVLP